MYIYHLVYYLLGCATTFIALRDGRTLELVFSSSGLPLCSLVGWSSLIYHLHCLKYRGKKSPATHVHTLPCPSR